MKIPVLFDELNRLNEDDYIRAGLICNPAYSNLRRGDDTGISISREALETKIKETINKFFSSQEERPRHLYLFSRHSGAGKSHTQGRIKDYCKENKIPFVELEHEDHNDGNVRKNLPYIMKLLDTDKILAFLECDHSSRMYERLCEVEGVLIIGSGHNPWSELRRVGGSFEILDLERDYPLTTSQLTELLRQTMKKITITGYKIIDDGVIEEIARNSQSPGEALNILGVCLAVYAYKKKIGQEYTITVEDAQQWSYRNMQKD